MSSYGSSKVIWKVILKVLWRSFESNLVGNLAGGISWTDVGESPGARFMAPPLEVEQEPFKQSLVMEKVTKMQQL